MYEIYLEREGELGERERVKRKATCWRCETKKRSERERAEREW